MAAPFSIRQIARVTPLPDNKASAGHNHAGIRYNDLMPDQPCLVTIVPNLMFATRIEDAARSAGAIVLSPIDQAAFLAALRNGAKLVIIDSSADTMPWLDWVRAAKDDPIAESVPIIAFGSHKDTHLRDRALGAGVDRYLARSNFSEGLIEFIVAAVRETTANPCSEPLPIGVLRGLEEFNAGQYFEQHETLELVWRAELRPIRDLYRGVLQIGVACLQVERGNAIGALKMIDRAEKWLQPFRPSCQSIDVDRLLEDAVRLREEIERRGATQIDRVDRRLFPKVHTKTGR
jgi:predicted metal-dependent hydrolase